VKRFIIFLFLIGCAPLGKVTEYSDDCFSRAEACIESCQNLDEFSENVCKNECDDQTTGCLCKSGSIKDKSLCCWVGYLPNKECCPNPGIKTGC
jgi:hypothetical protein